MEFIKALSAGTRLRHVELFGSEEREGGVTAEVGKPTELQLLSRTDKNGNSAEDEKSRAKRLRKAERIHVHHGKGGGQDVPPPIHTFEDLLVADESTSRPEVPRWVIKNVTEVCKFSSPTSIQKQAIPCILSSQPLLASAPTGSGKTLAYLLPIVTLLRAPGKEFIRALVICPSRELAHQIHRHFKALTQGKKFRSRLLNSSVASEVEKGRRRLDFVVTTPLSAVQLCREGKVKLSEVKHLVVDEADKLLELGFAPQIDEILSFTTNPSIQKLFFSATLPDNVVELVESVVHAAPRISVGAVGAAASSIEQRMLFVTDEQGKLPALRALVKDGLIKPPTLVFVQSKERADELFAELAYDGLFVDVMHGDKTAAQRTATIRSFRAQKIWVLLCTDLLGRGIDFKGVKVVVNYDFPQSAADYIHRIGRTGRAGHTGTAITFFTVEDLPNLRLISGVMRQSGCEVPDWITRLPKKRAPDKRHLQRAPPKRERISTSLAPAKPVNGVKRRRKGKKKVGEGEEQQKLPEEAANDER